MGSSVPGLANYGAASNAIPVLLGVAFPALQSIFATDHFEPPEGRWNSFAFVWHRNGSNWCLWVARVLQIFKLSYHIHNEKSAHSLQSIKYSPALESIKQRFNCVIQMLSADDELDYSKASKDLCWKHPFSGRALWYGAAIHTEIHFACLVLQANIILFHFAPLLAFVDSILFFVKFDGVIWSKLLLVWFGQKGIVLFILRKMMHSKEAISRDLSACLFGDQLALKDSRISAFSRCYSDFCSVKPTYGQLGIVSLK